MRNLATPGAVLMLVGMFAVYWALTSRHGSPPTSWMDAFKGKAATHRIGGPFREQGHNHSTPGFGGGSSHSGDGASGSF